MRNIEQNYYKYKEYRVNRHRYKTEQVTFPIVMFFLIGLFSRARVIVIIMLGIIIVKYVVDKIEKNKVNIEKKSKEKQEKTKENFDLKMNNMRSGKTTDIGYINKNKQKNNGRSSRRGTDNNQWFYDMSCLECGHTYNSNGTDIWQRKCPNCQGGKP